MRAAKFERLIALRNVWLLSEEYDPHSRRLVGNFPQAFPHVALVNSAYRFLGRAAPATQPDEPALDDEIMGSRMQRTRIGAVFA